ncbi:MAG: DUF362 domain-containing protein [Candidatus Omnitrophica bacterium]|nr:DUF362 domain-containing protein [Candidatus Omnitrophota bacterium]MDD5592992.1 DUF362 domain-containing protein [Candidatus Omnitrophota bacterium]
MNAQVAIVKCSDYQPSLVSAAVRRAIDLFGGITKFIKPESKVLVKPNLLMAKDPDFGVNTHPEVVRAVVKILKEIDCRLYLGDGPSVWGNQIENVDEVYRRSGMRDLCEEEGVELVKFDKRRWREKFPLTAWLDECDYVVNLPKFKTHDFTLMTAAIKNLFGLVPGTYKTELHKNYFHPPDFARILVDIYQEVKPGLTLVDGITAMEGDGPATGGKLRHLGLLFAGSDCIALDAIMALIMGVKPFDVLTTKEAAARGLGVADIKSISILGEKLNEVMPEPFILPSTSFKKNIPQPILEIARKLIKYYPYVKRVNCILCAACVKACPQKVISMKNNRIVIDYRGCISCFCCQEACPHSAIKVKKSLLAKLIGL